MEFQLQKINFTESKNSILWYKIHIVKKSYSKILSFSQTFDKKADEKVEACLKKFHFKKTIKFCIINFFTKHHDSLVSKL